MTTNHSLGPWAAKEYFGDDDDSWFYDHTIVDEAGKFVCHTSFTSVWGGTNKYTDANAALIVAAPELLAACRAFTDWYYGDRTSPVELMETAGKIIAAANKAVGRGNQ